MHSQRSRDLDPWLSQSDSGGERAPPGIHLAMSRWMGIDMGERRIGIAISDPGGVIASPLTTLVRRAGKRPPWAELERLVREYEVAGFAVGLPLNLTGDETDWTREVREFAAALERRTGLPVAFVDERMTSVLAERTVRGSGLPRSRREERHRIDETAAAIILGTYLEQKRNRELE